MNLKFISWNVNGLRAVTGKNFYEDFNSLDADFFCLQETKLQEGQIQMDLPGYFQYWNYAQKKAILERQFLQNTSRFRFFTELEFLSTTPKAA